tara:strand:+ start:100 stop:477 length:378 start_codon:yes stop_codon:yes gene_type:complete
MRNEITTEYAKRAQKEASWAYNKSMENFYYSMLEVVFLRIKSHLSEQGLKKVIKMDEERHNNKDLGVEFSQKTWKVLAESWAGAEGLAMTKIADLYGLEISDLDISKIEKLKEKPIAPNCKPTAN